MKTYVIALISLLVVSESAIAAGNVIRLSGTVPERAYRIQNTSTQNGVLVTTESTSFKVYATNSTTGQSTLLDAGQTLAASSLIRVEAP